MVWALLLRYRAFGPADLFSQVVASRAGGILVV